MVITAKVGVDVKGSLPVTTAGKFGGAAGGDAKLTVQDTIPSGSEILFYVNDFLAEEVEVKEEGEDWKAVAPEWVATFTSGEFWGLNLRAKVPVIPPEPNGPPAPIGGGGGGGEVTVPPPTLSVSLELEESGSLMSAGCVTLDTVSLTSSDGNLTITIPVGTCCLDIEEYCLASLTMNVDPSPPPPPEGAHIIGLAYDFEPDGATFSPPGIMLEFIYNPDDIPEGVAEGDLVLAYYDEDAGVWVELDCDVDTENNIITAYITGFTTFAIIAGALPPAPAAFSLSNLTVQPAEVQPKEAVTVAVSVANTGGTEGSYTVVLKINGVKEAEQTVTVAAGGSQSVSFSTTREEVASYSVAVDGLSSSFTVVAPAPPAPPAEPPINWPLIGAIIAGVVLLVGLVIFLLVRSRRRAY